jgi:hypothetical protein
MSERGEHRLVEGFTHRRMGVDRQGEPKGGGRFRHARAGGVDAENDTVVGARDDSHEALLGKTTLRRPKASLARRAP